jgi:hypothetical protein
MIKTLRKSFEKQLNKSFFKINKIKHLQMSFNFTRKKHFKINDFVTYFTLDYVQRNDTIQIWGISFVIKF